MNSIEPPPFFGRGLGEDETIVYVPFSCLAAAKEKILFVEQSDWASADLFQDGCLWKVMCAAAQIKQAQYPITPQYRDWSPCLTLQCGIVEWPGLSIAG